jgi:RNA polymerase sigma-70 factor (ECF subfamily)
VAEPRGYGEHYAEMETQEPSTPPGTATGGRPPVRGLGPRFPQVLANAAAGDGSAFAELWRSAHPGLLRYLFVFCSDMAEDVASETWLKVLRNIDTFSGDEQAFRGWLAAIARNAAMDRRRHAYRHPERLDGITPEHTPAPAPDPADLAIEALATRAILELVTTILSPAVAEMVVLRVVLGLDVPQVGELVGRSPGAVRVAVHRGLKTLAEALSPVPDATSASSVTVTTDQALTVR